MKTIRKEYIDPRALAYKMACRLEKSGLKGTMMYRMISKEHSRDLLLAEPSRIELALMKAEPLFEALVNAGRSRPKRRVAIAAILAAKTRVR